MRCSIQGCPGEYELKEITHTVRHQGQIVVIEKVPAEVCAFCGDVSLTPETVRHIESLLEHRSEPARVVPLYRYA